MSFEKKCFEERNRMLEEINERQRKFLPDNFDVQSVSVSDDPASIAGRQLAFREGVFFSFNDIVAWTKKEINEDIEQAYEALNIITKQLAFTHFERELIAKANENDQTAIHLIYLIKEIAVKDQKRKDVKRQNKEKNTKQKTD